MFLFLDISIFTHMNISICDQFIIIQYPTVYFGHKYSLPVILYLMVCCIFVTSVYLSLKIAPFVSLTKPCI